jgi:pyrroloquinoline quinone (PQQ) biosynthesis protein C
MATDVVDRTFVDEIFKEIVYPARDQLMDSPYFTDLRNGKLTTRRLQGFALEHHWFNWRLLKGGGLRMLNAGSIDALSGSIRGLVEEHTHPDMAKKFGLSLGLTEEDFENHIPTNAVLEHTSVIVASPITLGNPAAGRVSGMLNETLVQRYATEYAEYLPHAPYNCSDDAIEFFTVHAYVDVGHSEIAAQAVARLATTDRDKEVAWYWAKHQAKLKLAKFQSIYDEYV